MSPCVHESLAITLQVKIVQIFESFDTTLITEIFGNLYGSGRILSDVRNGNSRWSCPVVRRERLPETS